MSIFLVLTPIERNKPFKSLKILIFHVIRSAGMQYLDFADFTLSNNSALTVPRHFKGRYTQFWILNKFSYFNGTHFLNFFVLRRSKM